jgi:hypothetical protein
MASAARLFPPAPKPKGGKVQPPVAKVTVKRSPKAARDPRFMKVVDRLQATTARTLVHPPAASKAAEAGAAAKAPDGEQLAAGKSGQVDSIEEAKTGKSETSTFEQLLRAKIQELMPKTLGDAEKFGQHGEKEKLSGAVSGNVKEQKDAAAAPMKEASTAAPQPAGEAKQETPLPTDAPAQPAGVDPGSGMPPPKQQQEVSLEQQKKDVIKRQDDAEITDAQLQKGSTASDGKRYSSVLESKGAVVAQADAAPKQYRNDEQKVLTQAAQKARGAEKSGLASYVALKGKGANQVKSKQQLAAEQDAADRAKVVADLNAIYEKTAAAVKAKLDSLETDALAMFQAGADAAFENMKSFVDNKMSAYKLDRYLLKWGPLIGGGLWIKDLLLGMPDEVNRFVEEGKTRFLAEMDALITKVSAFVEGRLQEARDEVKRGQDEIKSHVESLPKNLQKYGQEAAKNIDSKFDELKNSIEERKNDLADKLAEKYKEANDKADQFVKDFKEANKGLVQKFVEFLGEIIEFLTKLKDRLMSIIRKGVAVIKKIIADPIGFLGNLLAAIKQGLSQFVSNIWTHLKAGFMKWLFGTLASAGVQIPSDLSLPSILKLAAQILGLTWENIRPKIVRKIGERGTAFLEKMVSLLYTLFTGGWAALWAEIKGMVGDLKAMVIDAIQNWLITKIVQSAIAKLATMFNPAGAIIQAVITIYNTVMFLVENINSILDFVEAVINSLDAIADGAISGAASWIEQALARLIPLLIGFLARLIGLGGIADKIKAFIKKVQAPISKAIDWLIDKIFNFVKGLFKGKDKKKDKDKKDERTDAEKQADLEKGVSEADALLADENKSPKDVKAALAAIKSKYKMVRLDLVTDSSNEEDDEETDHIEGEVNPKKAKPKRKKTGKGKPIGDLGIKRKSLSFTAPTKQYLLKKFKALFPPGQLGQWKKAKLDIRHKVSISDTIKHTNDALKGLSVADAAKRLTAEGFKPKGKGKPGIVAAARELLQKANNDRPNLFVGGRGINRRVKQRYDVGDSTLSRTDPRFDPQKAAFIGKYGFVGTDFKVTIDVTVDGTDYEEWEVIP